MFFVGNVERDQQFVNEILYRSEKKSRMENENDLDADSIVNGPAISELSNRFRRYTDMLEDQCPVDDIPKRLFSQIMDSLNEKSAKGQSLLLQCIFRWAREGATVDIQLHRKFLCQLLEAYCSIPSCSAALSSIFECLATRKLPHLSCDLLLDVIRQDCFAIVPKSDNSSHRVRLSISRPGVASKQLIGCLKIATNLIQSVPEFPDRMSQLSPDLARVISFAAFDRALREACYVLLALVITDLSEIPRLGLEPAQERELRSRIEKRTGNHANTTLIIHPSITSSSQECPISTPSLSSARSTKIGKDGITRIRECAKWQEKRDLLVRLSKDVSSTNPSTLSNDFLCDFFQFFKEESNVPVLVACFELVNSFANSEEIEVSLLRKFLFLCVSKLREKNPSVHRVIKTTVGSILKRNPSLCDSSLISHLSEISKVVTRKDLLGLVQEILCYVSSITDRCRLIQQVIAPALADTNTRECALGITKQLLAHTASDNPSKLEEVIGVIEQSTSDLSTHRKRIIRDALGFSAPQEYIPAKVIHSPPRSPPKVRTGNADVSHLVRALVEGHSLVEPCNRIRMTLESSTSIQDSRLIEVMAKSVKPVLIGEDSDSRQAVLALIHTATRMVSVWESASVREMKIFLEEMLVIVDDKSLRQNEPEVWSDMNLSVVHAVANCNLPTA